EFKMGQLTPREERELEGICNLLSPFLQYTLKISTETTVATELFLVADELDEHLNKIINDESQGVVDVAKSMKDDLNRRMEK
ncbi:hypothetical protein PENTCL1PPCAC_4964, partial [Pristionchus entomophagus]